MARLILWGRITVIALIVAVVVNPQLLASQQPETCRFNALKLDRLKSLLANDQDLRGVRAPFAYVDYIERCGVAFIPSEKDVQDLISLEAPAALLALLQPPANPTRTPSWTPRTDGQEMRWVGPGTNLMGSPATEPGRGEDEEASEITVDVGFWLDHNEVTNEAFRKFVLADSTWSKKSIGGSYLKDWTGDNFPAGAALKPVVYVTWDAARAYAEWAGKRLPTELEWEYAARAGDRGPYWWGTAEFNPTKANRGPEVLAVDRMKTSENGLGLLDMLGNVWEWTSSAYKPYPYRVDDRESPVGTEPRVIRGGAFGSNVAFVRAAKRASLKPSTVAVNVGFRCAYSPARRSSGNQ